MNWFERYVASVKSYLPDNLKQDVGEEIFTDLQDQQADMEAQFERKLTEPEVLDLLKKRGHPMQLAAAYQPRRTLVSEALFPIFTQVIKWVFLALLLGHGMAALIGVISATNPHYVQVALQWIGNTVDSAVWAFAAIVLVFYLIGESTTGQQWFANWQPDSLPAMEDSGRQISSLESVFELIFSVLFLGWINELYTTDGGAGFELIPSAELIALLPWANVLVGSAIVISLTKLISPFWTKPKAITDFIFDAFMLATLTWMAFLENAFSVRWNSESELIWPEQTWLMGLAVLGLLTLWDMATQVRRYRQLNTK